MTCMSVYSIGGQYNIADRNWFLLLEFYSKINGAVSSHICFNLSGTPIHIRVLKYTAIIILYLYFVWFI